MSDLVSVPFEEKRFYYPRGAAGDYLVRGPGDITGFEPEMTQYLRTTLRKDMVFLDVGAAWGYYTLLAANRVRNVICFEPQAATRAILLENIERNGLKNVAIVGKPLFSSAVRGFMRKDRLRLDPNGDYETVTLDSLYLSPDAMKIDVEGMELDVLMGAEKTLYRCKPILAIEIHKHKIRTFNHYWTEVHDFLRNLGYVVTPLGERRLVRFIKAEFEGP